MQPLESRPQAARILAFRKFKRICRLHLNRVPFVATLIDLKAKAGGEKSMSEKRGSLEDAEGVVPQDPRERAKAGLPCVVLSNFVSPIQ